MIANSHNEMSELGPDTDNQQITTFVDDVNLETYEKPLMSSVSAWTNIAQDKKLHDIHAILKRPVIVAEGELNTASSPISLKFPDVIFQKSVNVVKKLDYFTYFRANVKIRLVFNATPFMSGKYWMFFAPFDVVSNRPALTDNLPNNTGYPGIEVDLASNAPVEIKIPYCAPLSHYNLIDTHSNMGELYLVAINAIQTGTSPVVAGKGAAYTMFAWFEDVELAMPTSLPVTMPPVPDTVLRAQVGKSEEQAATSGPSISGVANAVASASGALGSIPILGPWVRPVEWVSRAIGSVASAFGWNKPTNLDKNCPYSNITAKGYTHADGIDLSTKLGAMPDNGLTYDTGIFSTDVDEMDIKYVASKSCIYRQAIPWTLLDVAGTTLHFNTVSPGMCEGSASVLKPTTLAYLASMFRYWRGGLNYRIAVAKTAFHTGRLRITYHPGVYAVNPLSVSENAYNWILDLSVSSELEFKIPYVANVPWKETLLDAPLVSVWKNEEFSTGLLTIEVLTPLRRASDSVANNCPFNMWISGADDISFAIPDFGNYFVLTPPTMQEPIDDEDEPLRAQVFNLTQSGIEHNEQMEGDSQEVFPISTMNHTTAEELTMGEKISNLRQLCKRFAPTTVGCSWPYQMELDDNRWAIPGPIPLNNDLYLYNQITIDPAFFGAYTTSAIDEQTVSVPVGRSDTGVPNPQPCRALRYLWTSNPLHRISYLYRFYRGGKRYKVVNPTTNDLQFVTTGIRAAETAITGTADKYTTMEDSTRLMGKRPNEPIFSVRDWQILENGDVEKPFLDTFPGLDQNPIFEHLVYPDLNGVLEFEVPYYGQTPISVVGEGKLSNIDGPLVRRALVHLRRSHFPRGMDLPIYSYLSDEANVNTIPSQNVGVNLNRAGGQRPCFGGFTLYEAAADDFSFGYLVGAPTLERTNNP